MTPSTSLVVVVHGEAYEAYAERLFESAKEYFHPTEEVRFVTLPGKPGWPDATMFRHEILRDNFPRTDYVFLVDADMEFQGHVGKEILGRSWVTATLHPGYVGKPRHQLPYEEDHKSYSFVPDHKGGKYYCGGFIGGTRGTMNLLVTITSANITKDLNLGIVPRWHDESALNRVLAFHPPQVELSPAYCYPENDSYYKQEVWKETYERKLVALDKTQEERGVR